MTWEYSKEDAAGDNFTTGHSKALLGLSSGFSWWWSNYSWKTNCGYTGHLIFRMKRRISETNIGDLPGQGYTESQFLTSCHVSADTFSNIIMFLFGATLSLRNVVLWTVLNKLLVEINAVKLLIWKRSAGMFVCVMFRIHPLLHYSSFIASCFSKFWKRSHDLNLLGSAGEVIFYVRFTFEKTWWTQFNCHVLSF